MVVEGAVIVVLSSVTVADDIAMVVLVKVTVPMGHVIVFWG